jgi:hypothetical protein
MTDLLLLPTDLACDGLNGHPLRWVLASMLQHHPYSAFAHLRGELRGLLHGSILYSWSLLKTRAASLVGEPPG